MLKLKEEAGVYKIYSSSTYLIAFILFMAVAGGIGFLLGDSQAQIQDFAIFYFVCLVGFFVQKRYVSTLDLSGQEISVQEFLFGGIRHTKTTIIPIKDILNIERVVARGAYAAGHRLKINYRVQGQEQYQHQFFTVSDISFGYARKAQKLEQELNDLLAPYLGDSKED